MKLMKVALAVTALFLLCGVSFAQADWSWQRDNDHNRSYSQQDQKAYQKGVRDGQNDRRHNRAAHPRHNDRDYLAGYRAGYGQGYDRRDHRRNDRDADDGYGRGATRGSSGQPQNVQRVAYNNGFQEGMRYGQGDRNGRHSYRPTNSDNYKHGTTGYMGSLGDKNVYKQDFQQGFRAGYDRGYYGR